MEKLLVMLVAVLAMLSFSMVGFAAQQNAAGSHQTMISEKKMGPDKMGAMSEKTGIMEVATGKVLAVDPEGKAITITEKVAGKGEMDVGTIVGKDTIVKINGKEAALKDIKVGDTVTIHYVKSDNLYAREVSKA